MEYTYIKKVGDKEVIILRSKVNVELMAELQIRSLMRAKTIPEIRRLMRAKKTLKSSSIPKIRRLMEGKENTEEQFHTKDKEVNGGQRKH